MTASRPGEPGSPEGLDRMAAAVLQGGRIAAVRRLGGGVAATTHALAFRRPDGAQRQLVLKRYPPGDETPRLEWERLGCAARVALPTPEPVALDADGDWFGTPALLMSALPGHVEMHPADLDAWTRELAHALAAIHRANLGGAVPSAVRRPHLWARWQLGHVEVDDRTAAATAAIERLRREAPGERAVFYHDDFHPGNVLFDQGVVTGVVDWSSARLAPRAADVANCRADILWLESFADVGVRLSVEHVRSAAERFLDDALARC